MHKQPPQPPYNYDIEDCQAILLKEVEKLYTILAQEILGQSISDYIFSTLQVSPPLPSSSSLPLLTKPTYDNNTNLLY
ncbi:MAG TPA: hypothetical protein VFJ05_00205 [Nitrososphaeraceae archaeon]|nr:hypothetical protein [Nitrososphaeraceae archaeon]